MRLNDRVRRPAARSAPFIPGVATAAAVLLTPLGACDPISLREQNEAAGFNGGFEVVQRVKGVDGVQGGLPANWYFNAEPLHEGDAEVALDGHEPVEGLHALRFEVHEADSVAGAHTAGLFQVVPAEPLRTYRVSFWLKIRGARALVVVRSENASSATPGRVQVFDEAVAGPEKWRRFEYVYGVPEGFDNIRFQLNVTRPGTLWLDDVRIEEI